MVTIVTGHVPLTVSMRNVIGMVSVHVHLEQRSLDDALRTVKEAVMSYLCVKLVWLDIMENTVMTFVQMAVRALAPGLKVNVLNVKKDTPDQDAYRNLLITARTT